MRSKSFIAIKPIDLAYENFQDFVYNYLSKIETIPCH